MTLSTAELERLVHHGWRETMREDEFLKMYDGYVATLRFSPDKQSIWLWSIWLTDSLPIQYGWHRYPMHASQQCDKAVAKLGKPR